MTVYEAVAESPLVAPVAAPVANPFSCRVRTANVAPPFESVVAEPADECVPQANDTTSLARKPVTVTVIFW